ncbi:hypothetical protein [Streptomyces sp. NL15-2K]|uniref:hypothetical protein n=1 Tax=Streptomyces sp. NL15-2K TaxID=376149 RepID=UPI000FF958B2|nr:MULTISPECIES: hypothetical protein [Actinomycetes]WKX15916.1 hypothetical protein Q4V64_53920 [Kutzneria buriramensis]GCB53143.1 hypothetical protein SNL152K_10500 [Streptomyces sp. NL15-2K]
MLEGLLEHERTTGGSAESVSARRRGEQFLLQRRLFRRLSTGEVVDPTWLRFSFPTWWHYDVLRALDYFRAAGDDPGPRLAEAIDMVQSKRQPDDTWLLENTHRGASFTETQGQVSGTRLFLEIQARGYQGSRQVVRKHLAALRAGTAEPVRADIPSPRKITSWIMRPRETLTDSQDRRLLEVRLACPDITRACDLARAFADLFRHRRGYLLLEWIRQAEQDAPKPMQGFAGSLRQDLDAVTAGLWFYR